MGKEEEKQAQKEPPPQQTSLFTPRVVSWDGIQLRPARAAALLMAARARQNRKPLPAEPGRRSASLHRGGHCLLHGSAFRGQDARPTARRLCPVSWAGAGGERGGGLPDGGAFCFAPSKPHQHRQRPLPAVTAQGDGAARRPCGTAATKRRLSLRGGLQPVLPSPAVRFRDRTEPDPLPGQTLRKCQREEVFLLTLFSPERAFGWTYTGLFFRGERMGCRALEKSATQISLELNAICNF